MHSLKIPLQNLNIITVDASNPFKKISEGNNHILGHGYPSWPMPKKCLLNNINTKNMFGSLQYLNGSLVSFASNFRPSDLTNIDKFSSFYVSCDSSVATLYCSL